MVLLVGRPSRALVRLAGRPSRSVRDVAPQSPAGCRCEGGWCHREQHVFDGLGVAQRLVEPHLQVESALLPLATCSHRRSTSPRINSGTPLRVSILGLALVAHQIFWQSLAACRFEPRPQTGPASRPVSPDHLPYLPPSRSDLSSGMPPLGHPHPISTSHQRPCRFDVPRKMQAVRGLGDLGMTGQLQSSPVKWRGVCRRMNSNPARRPGSLPRRSSLCRTEQYGNLV